MFRFTIRDVLWLTVVVALALAWGIDHRRLAISLRESQQREIVAEARGKIRMESGPAMTTTRYVPATIPAVVLVVQENVCELGVGSDDAVTVGTEFSVSRKGAQLGFIIVTETSPDRCFGDFTPQSPPPGKSQPVGVRKGDSALATNSWKLVEDTASPVERELLREALREEKELDRRWP